MNIPPHPAERDIVKLTTELVNMLASIKRGALIVDFHDKLRQAIEVSSTTNKASSLTMALKLSPDDKTEAMRVSGKVTVKLPPDDEKEALFWVKPDFTLSRLDTKQVQMFPSPDDQEI